MMIALIVGSVTLALLGLVVVRRWIPLERLVSHHEVAGYFITVLATIYALLLSFVLLTEWSEYEETRRLVTREGEQARMCLRLARSIDPERGEKFAMALRHYVRSVVDIEWPAMTERRAAPETEAALNQLWDEVRLMDIRNAREAAVYGELVETLKALSVTRRDRLHECESLMPELIWWVLMIGAALTISFTYFFGLKNLRSQALMTAALTLEIVLVIIVITALDNPFTGPTPVHSMPLRNLLG